MTVTVSEQKIVAQSQRFVFENLVIQRQGENLSANIQFAVFNEKNERIGTHNYDYRNEQFNTFWADFNSGKFLYEELAKKSQLNMQLDESIENDFVYVKPVEPVVEQPKEDGE
jgi:hypothetical protein